MTSSSQIDQQLDINYNLRGSSYMLETKKSYKIEFENNISLLGMRNDDDWILNSLYNEFSNIKEKLSIDIWDELSGINKYQAEYVELIIDGQYQGLYLLQETVDHKTYDFENGNNYIYTIANEYLGPIDSNTSVAISEDGDIMINAYQLDKVKIKDIEKSEELIKMISYDFTNNHLNEIFEYDYNNFVKYNIFINIIIGLDNHNKNQKIVLRNNGDDTFVIQKTPWDFDQSFAAELPDYAQDGYILDQARNNNTFDSKELKKLEADVYFSFREHFTDEQLTALVDNYIELLVGSGAIYRDNFKWQDKDFVNNTKNVLEIGINRLNFMDEYLEGYYGV